MRVLELVCDSCGKREKGDEYHFGLPKGWYVLGYHCQVYLASDDWRVLNHFCSWECMVAKVNATGEEKTAVFKVKA